MEYTVGKNLSTFNFNNFPKAFVLFLCLFLATECFIAFFFSRYISNDTNCKIKAEIRIAQRRDANYDILVFGDSSAAQAIDTARLDEYTGLTSFNFALMGDATLAGNYFLFKKYLAAHKIPKYVVLMNVYDVWHRGYSDETFQILAINFPWDFIKMAFYPQIDRERYLYLIKEISAYILPSQRYRYEIKNIIGTKEASDYRSKHIKSILKFERKLLKLKGFSEEKEMDENSIMLDMHEHKDLVKSNEFVVSKLNLYYLDMFLRVCERNDIKVFLCFPPILKELYEQEIKGNYLRSYESFLRDKSRYYTKAILVTDGFYVVPMTSLSYTIDHLNEKGASDFTRILGEKIRQEL